MTWPSAAWTQDGTVVPSIAAGAAQDAAGNVNTASTSGDNSVSFVVGPLPQAVPLTQDFTAGLPGLDQGWEYYSTGVGRIQVTNGQLRLDDRVNNNVFSLNEAILHVNLAGQTNVKLQLVKVTDLTTKFTARTLALDTLLQQAAAAASTMSWSPAPPRLRSWLRRSTPAPRRRAQAWTTPPWNLRAVDRWAVDRIDLREARGLLAPAEVDLQSPCLVV